MPDIIRLLPDSLANQIAAGEVVQRPASAVKELLENSIDAGAANIKVIIKDAGKTLMQIIDDGKGMSETDARMSLERHATSKISKSEDLFAIKTMGFRGEALASVAAVSQFELKTREHNHEIGTLLLVEASAVKKQEPVACAAGTSISIKNLFYNVPARRNFLKSNGVEMRHIIEEFQRIALANPSVGFQLWQADMETYNLPAGKLSQRIVNLFGKNYQEQLVSCDEQTTDLTVHGYIGKPEFAKKTRGEQFFFVNNRFIKSNYLNHAVVNAFEGLLQEGSYPFYVLFITIDSARVDVNVHPTKTEVKFDDERTLYAIVRAAVRQALATHHVTPALDFSADINLTQKYQASRESIKDKNYSQFKSDSPRQQANLDNWERLFGEHEGRGLVTQPEDDQKLTLTFESSANTAGEEEEKIMGKAIHQFHNRYIVTQVKSGLMLVDQQTAHERILYEKYLRALKDKSGASQQLLFPQTVSLSLADHALVMEMEEEIHALGFLTEPFGKNDILIKGVPTDIVMGNERQLYEGLIEQFKANRAELSLSPQDNLARAMARRTAIKGGLRLKEEEMSGIIDGLFACETPHYGPSGQKTFYILELNTIENFFKG